MRDLIYYRITFSEIEIELYYISMPLHFKMFQNYIQSLYNNNNNDLFIKNIKLFT